MSAGFDKVHRDAVDQTAAKVFAKGVQHHNGKKLTMLHWQSCPPLRKIMPGCADLKGIRFGRFEVIGLYAHGKNPGRWICRCSCGDFETRTAHSIRNPENFGDRCHKCRGDAFIKKDYAFHKFGEVLDQRKL